MTTIKLQRLSRLVEIFILVTKMQSRHITKPIRRTILKPILDTHYAMGNIVLPQHSVQPIAVLVTTAPLTILAQMILHLDLVSRPLLFYLSSVASVLASDQPDKDKDKECSWLPLGALPLHQITQIHWLLSNNLLSYLYNLSNITCSHSTLLMQHQFSSHLLSTASKYSQVKLMESLWHSNRLLTRFLSSQWWCHSSKYQWENQHLWGSHNR